MFEVCHRLTHVFQASQLLYWILSTTVTSQGTGHLVSDGDTCEREVANLKILKGISRFFLWFVGNTPALKLLRHLVSFPQHLVDVVDDPRLLETVFVPRKKNAPASHPLNGRK